MGDEEAFDPLEDERSLEPGNLGRYMKQALSFALTVVILSAVLGLSLSERALVQRVEVRAADVNVAREVAAALRLPPRLNTIWSSLQPIAEQARRCPRVKRVRVERDLPDTLIVHLDVRKPVFALADGGGFAVLDEEGVVLSRTGRLPSAYPVVFGLQARQCITGRRLRSDILQIILQCLEGAKRAGMPLGFTLDLSTPFDYRLHSPFGATIRLGAADNLVRKVIVGATVERHLRQLKQRPAYVDVRVPERDPTWAPET